MANRHPAILDLIGRIFDLCERYTFVTGYYTPYDVEFGIGCIQNYYLRERCVGNECIALRLPKSAQTTWDNRSVGNGYSMSIRLNSLYDFKSLFIGRDLRSLCLERSEIIVRSHDRCGIQSYMDEVGIWTTVARIHSHPMYYDLGRGIQSLSCTVCLQRTSFNGVVCVDERCLSKLRIFAKFTFCLWCLRDRIMPDIFGHLCAQMVKIVCNVALD